MTECRQPFSREKRSKSYRESVTTFCNPAGIQHAYSMYAQCRPPKNPLNIPILDSQTGGGSLWLWECGSGGEEGGAVKDSHGTLGVQAKQPTLWELGTTKLQLSNQLCARQALQSCSYFISCTEIKPHENSVSLIWTDPNNNTKYMFNSRQILAILKYIQDRTLSTNGSGPGL